MSEQVWRDRAEIPHINQCENVEQYDAGQIGDEMKRIDSQATWSQLYDAAVAWRAAGDALGGVARTLRDASAALAGGWSSEDSAQCQRALQRMEATARHLASRSRDVESFANGSAESLERTIANFPWGEWYKPGGTEDREHREALAALNAEYTSVNSTLPHSVAAELPVIAEGDRWEEPPPPPPMSPSRPPSAAMPPPGASSPGGFEPPAPASPAQFGGSAGVPGGGGADAGGFPEEGFPPARDDGSTGGLAGAGGFGPGGGATTGGLGGGVPAGGSGSAGLGGAGAGLPGLGAAGRAAGALRRGAGIGGRPVRGGAGAGVVGTPMGGGARGAGGTAGGRAGGAAGGRPGAGGGRPGAAGGARTAGGMMPMAGGRGGAGGDSASRDTWLTEDDDPWGADHDAPPSVIE